MSGAVQTALLINWLFWSGLAIGAIVLAALLVLTRATWSLPLQVRAARLLRFLPVSALTLAVLGAETPGVSPRSVAAAAATYLAALWFCRSMRSDVPSPRRPAAIVVTAYVAAFSLIAHDMMTAVQPNWIDSLFPPYVLATNVLGGSAALTLASAFRRNDVSAANPRLFRDTGRTLIGWSLICLYLLWSQFLVIWYGNLPAEVSFISDRLLEPWRSIGVLELVLRFAPPMVLLILARAWRPRLLMATATASLIGFWIEGWLLVGPASTPVSPGVLIAVTVGSAVAFSASQMPLRLRRLKPT